MTDSEWRPWAEDADNVQHVLDPDDQREDRTFPHPLTEPRFQQVVQELPTGARLALHTCLSSWRVRNIDFAKIIMILIKFLQNGQFTTAEFISFLICYKGNSKTLCEIFDSNQTVSNPSDWNNPQANRSAQVNDKVGPLSVCFLCYVESFGIHCV